MTTALRVLQYQLEDVRRSRGVLAFTLVLLGLTELLIRFGGGGPRAVLSLVSLVLLVVPLVSLLFGATYLYGARDFTELLLAQPVTRGTLFGGLYLGLALPLAAGFALAMPLPFLWHAVLDRATLAALAGLLGAGVLLTLTFTALAFLIAVHVEDRARGLGAAVFTWLLATVIYDGLILGVVVLLERYPLEAPLIGLMLLNPVDLGRVLLVLQLDTGALTGYTGAVFQRFFGHTTGTLAATTALLIWATVPLLLARRRFGRKDF